MVDATIEHELSTYLDRLPVEQQRQVLEFARTLVAPAIRGMAGSSLLRFAGAIGESDLDVIAQAVEEDCEGVDVDEW